MENAEWPTSPLGGGIRGAHDWLRLEVSTLVGPSGWRSVVGPAVFVVLAIALLIYDRINDRMTDVLFWLTLGLIVTVFARMLETNRRQRLAIERHRREALSDEVTGLPTRLALEGDLAAAGARRSERRVLVLLELDGLQAYNDRHGRTAGDDLLREASRRLVEAAQPLGGAAYRFDECRLAVLVPAGQQQPGEIVLAATAVLPQAEGEESPIGRAYGEVVIPEDATEPDLAFRIAGHRLAAHKQRQQRSARRQAHAVLMAALSSRRPELRDHLRVVAYRAISLARRLGVDRERIDDIALAAELQDVGMLTVPESVLEKQGPLSDEEVAMIHRHPIEGERIVGAAAGLAPVAKLIRSSSERFDGSGYPDGLAAEAIPVGARIIAVAVAFAAMTSNRPYRPASSTEDALAELRRCAGSQFDPAVVEALAVDLADEAAPAPPLQPAR